MKELITLVIFILASTFIYPQESKKDSLLYQLELKGSLSKPDSMFFNKLENNVLVAPNGTHYYIKKFIPDKSIDYKILEVVVDSTIDYKIMKFNPDKSYVPGKADKNLLDLLRKKYKREKKHK
jgi:hypothetical protein